MVVRRKANEKSGSSHRDGTVAIGPDELTRGRQPMRRKTRRLPIHYITLTVPDGAALTDQVIQEHRFAPNVFDEASDTVRIRMADLLRNRLNLRRTLRELVLPSLAIDSPNERIDHDLH